MRQPVNVTIFRVVGILMILIGALYNVAPALTLITGRGPVADQEAVVGPEAETPRAEVIQTTGAVPTPMGLMSFLHGPIMMIIGIGLVMLKRWEMFAAIAIIIDILVKSGTILSQLAIDRPLSEALIPLALIVIEVVMTYVILQQWNARRRMQRAAAQTGEVKRAL